MTELHLTPAPSPRQDTHNVVTQAGEVLGMIHKNSRGEWIATTSEGVLVYTWESGGPPNTGHMVRKPAAQAWLNPSCWDNTLYRAQSEL